MDDEPEPGWIELVHRATEAALDRLPVDSSLRSPNSAFAMLLRGTSDFVDEHGDKLDIATIADRVLHWRKGSKPRSEREAEAVVQVVRDLLGEEGAELARQVLTNRNAPGITEGLDQESRSADEHFDRQDSGAGVMHVRSKSRTQLSTTMLSAILTVVVALLAMAVWAFRNSTGSPAGNAAAPSEYPNPVACESGEGYRLFDFAKREVGEQPSGDATSATTTSFLNGDGANVYGCPKVTLESTNMILFADHQVRLTFQRCNAGKIEIDWQSDGTVDNVVDCVGSATVDGGLFTIDSNGSASVTLSASAGSGGSLAYFVSSRPELQELEREDQTQSEPSTVPLEVVGLSRLEASQENTLGVEIFYPGSTAIGEVGGGFWTRLVWKNKFVTLNNIDEK